ncbi:C-terminal binding protein [Thermoanaerobacteraceae bacterium SP2]|nr:C-terminal binding protein [Thermoanaerobacteraceae bacterium SP2]
MKKKVVVTDYNFENVNIERNIFEEAGYEFEEYKCKTVKETIEVTKDAYGILNQYAPLSEEVISGLNNCKAIARYAIGVDNIDITKATEKGILVSKVSGYCINEVADHTIALLLNMARKLYILDKNIKNKKWDYKVAKPIFRLQKSTVGIIGFGEIGRNVAQRLKAFNFEKILVYDPFVTREAIDKYGATKMDLNDIITQSDYIVINAPLNKDTYHLINKERFNMMKNNVVIINTGRGPLIDEKSLIEALKENKIGGVALDVTEIEPIQWDNPLLNFENVFITPHCAWYSEDSQKDLQTTAAKNLLLALEGKIHPDIVNPEALLK